MSSAAIESWRNKRAKLSLVGEVCPHCEKKIFPPKDICPYCSQEAKTPYAFSGKGKVFSFTIVRDPPEGFQEFAPYAVALIKLDEGPLVTAQLTDVDNNKVTIGMPVEMVTRRLRDDGDKGIIIYGYKFRPPMLKSAS